MLKENQTFKVYETKSNQYCIITVGSNTKASKTHYWIKCCYLFAFLAVYCNLCFLRLPQQQSFFSSWVVREKFRRILSDTRIKTCIKNRVYKNFNYVVSYLPFIERYANLSLPNLSTVELGINFSTSFTSSHQSYSIEKLFWTMLWYSYKNQGRSYKEWTWGGRFKSGLFLHRVNNIEHNIKQNIYTGMAVISHIPPFILYIKPARIKL